MKVKGGSSRVSVSSSILSKNDRNEVCYIKNYFNFFYLLPFRIYDL